MTRVLIALGLLSAAGVGLELTLTRLVSTLYSAAYVYLILSVALLGLGLGAAVLSLSPSWREHPSSFAASAGLSTLLLVLTLLKVPVGLELLLLAATVPFVFTGLALASIFAGQPKKSALLYWADLSGAGLGVLLLLPALDLWGVPSTGLVAALAFGVAGAVWARRPFPLLTGVVALAVLVLGLLTPLATLEPQILSRKPVGAALAEGGQIVQTRWDALTRSDLVYDAASDTYALYMDGGAGSVVPDLNRPELWEDDVGSFPFGSDPPQRTFLLGPGGGLDVALAKRAGAAELVAAELNGAGLELVSSLTPRVGDLYGGTTLLQGEGRRALEASGVYDLIFLSHVVTGSAELRNGSLSESTLYTKEAFGLYLDHLTPTGQLAVKLYDEVTLTRALTTAITVLSERGHTEAEAITHVVALLDARGDRPVPLLLVRKQAVSKAEAVRLGRLAEAGGYALLLLPHLLYPPPLEGVANGNGTLEAVVRSASTDLRPTTDDRPFFFLFGGPPRPLVVLLWVSLSLLAGLVGPSAHAFRRTPFKGVRGGLFFAALGAGFMLAEVFVLQRSQLVIGQPARTLSWVLAVLLVSSGLGSLLSTRFERRTVLPVGCGAVVVLLLLWSALAVWLGHPLPLLASLFPLGLALGLPFAAALRPLSARQVALAWAANGVGSVFGSALALLLATRFGYSAVLFTALGCYGLAAFTTVKPQRKNASASPPSTLTI